MKLKWAADCSGKAIDCTDDNTNKITELFDTHNDPNDESSVSSRSSEDSESSSDMNIQ